MITYKNRNIADLKNQIEQLFHANAVKDPGINEKHLRQLPEHSRMLIALAEKQIISTVDCVIYRGIIEGKGI